VTNNKPPLIAAFALAAAVLAAAAVGGLHALANDQAAAGAPAAPGTAQNAKPALTVTVVQPQPAQLAQVVSASGSIAAWQEASVGAEANGWRLAEVHVNVGDRVRRGQVLATFAASMPQADLAQAKAAVAEAEAMLAEATANAQRARDLQPSGALSAQQINQMLTAESTAKARLEAARAAAQVQTLRLAQTAVHAPDDGVISARSATVGAVVPAGQELFRLIRQGRLEWRAEVAATELARVAPGQSVKVVPAGGSPLTGKVRMVAPTVDAATRNGLVYVDLPQPGGANNWSAPGGANNWSAPGGANNWSAPGGANTWSAPGGARAGMFARGEFEVGSSGALTLPQSAVLLRDGFSYVFRVGADNKVVQTKITVGRRSGERIEVAGLDAQARVVAMGAAFLGDGDLVRVVDAATASAPAPARK
jgi:RND family efflux transporter MFP subunit